MKVLQLVTDTDRRGAQVFATDLEPALVARGHTVTTVALAPGTTAPPLPVAVLGSTRLSLATLRALRQMAADADVVIAHGSSTLPACALGLIASSTPFVYRQISESRFWAPTAARRARVRAFLSRAARVVSLSAASADVLVEDFGVDRSRLAIVPNGVPADAFAPAVGADRRAARARFGLDDDAFVVLSISALVPEKGVDLVVDAVLGLAAADRAPTVPMVQLLVAGAGPERAVLEARAHAGATVGATNGTIVFVGSLDDPVVAYQAADVIVLASRGGDSMPATLIEAAFAAVPAVVTDVGAITDVVVDGETGIVVPIDAVGAVQAALGALRGDAPWRAALGTQAREHCLARYEIAVVAAQWDAVLQAVVPAPAPGPGQ